MPSIYDFEKLPVTVYLYARDNLMKTYKVSYKTYFSDRLKEVSFHGIQTHPLYIQLTYMRRTMFFKSYYFDLFSKPRYAVKKGSKKIVPTLDAVIKKEHELINFIIDKLPAGFTLEEFKHAYDFYGADLVSEIQEGLRVIMYVFFLEKELPYMGRALTEGVLKTNLYYLIQDLRKSLLPELYEDIERYALNYPYLPMYAFVLSRSTTQALFCLTIMEWETGDTQKQFDLFLSENHNASESTAIKKGITSFIADLKSKK